MNQWQELSDDELRARLARRLDPYAVESLVRRRDHEEAAVIIDAVLA